MIIKAYGIPAPQGSKRAFGRTKLGRTIMVETSEKVTPWRADVMTACRRAIEETEDFTTFSCAMAVRMVFTFLRPKSVPYSKRPFPSVNPDVSKLARSTEDALQAAGVIKDDNLIVNYTRLAKVYAGEDPDALESPGAFIVLLPLVPLTPVRATPGR